MKNNETLNGAPGTNDRDMALSRDLFGAYFSSPAALPVSYFYEGKFYDGLPGDSVVTRKLLDANMIEVIFSGANRTTDALLKQYWG